VYYDRQTGKLFRPKLVYIDSDFCVYLQQPNMKTKFLQENKREWKMSWKRGKSAFVEIYWPCKYPKKISIKKMLLEVAAT
jgi:hypothetical protein